MTPLQLLFQQFDWLHECGAAKTTSNKLWCDNMAQLMQLVSDHPPLTIGSRHLSPQHTSAFCTRELLAGQGRMGMPDRQRFLESVQ